MGPIVRQAKAAGVHVITESNSVSEAVSYVGIDNYAGGVKAGEWFASYAADKGLAPKILIVGFPNFEDCRQRVDGFKDALAAGALIGLCNGLLVTKASINSLIATLGMMAILRGSAAAISKRHCWPAGCSRKTCGCCSSMSRPGE